MTILNCRGSQGAAYSMSGKQSEQEELPVATHPCMWGEQGWINSTDFAVICSGGAFWDSCITTTGISGCKDQVSKKDPCYRLFPISVAMFIIHSPTPKCFLDGSASCLKPHRPGRIKPCTCIVCDLEALNCVAFDLYLLIVKDRHHPWHTQVWYISSIMGLGWQSLCLFTPPLLSSGEEAFILPGTPVPCSSLRVQGFVKMR